MSSGTGAISPASFSGVPELEGSARTRRRVVVSGRVQGVGFRQSCAEVARLHRVAGWVRNRHDGAVEAAFEGPPEAVDAMVAWCRSGPRFAFVEQVEVADEAPEGLASFRVAATAG